VSNKVVCPTCGHMGCVYPHPDPWKSAEEKAWKVFAEAFGERADLFRARNGATPPEVRHILSVALAEDDPLTADQIAHHMVDWKSDAAFLVAVLLFPERFTSAELQAGTSMFLYAASPHVVAAARLAGDIFTKGDIAPLLKSLKTATDVSAFIREGDASPEQSELKPKLAELAEALEDAKLEAADIHQAILDRDEQIRELEATVQGQELDRAKEQAILHAADVVDAARRLLDRQPNFLEGVRAVVHLGYEPNGCDHAAGFSFFFWLNSMTAHLPGQAIREQCAESWLAKSDAEAEQWERRYGDRVDEEFRELLVRFEKRDVSRQPSSSR
jgi:hypothetical protein